MTAAVRSTRQRAAVSALLAETDEFRSAQDLHDLLRHRGDSVGLTTVYRSLQALADAGEVDLLAPTTARPSTAAAAPGTITTWSAARCGRTVEVAGPTVERWADSIAAEHGFTQMSHTLELFGTCAAARAAPERGTAGYSYGFSGGGTCSTSCTLSRGIASSRWVPPLGTHCRSPGPTCRPAGRSAHHLDRVRLGVRGAAGDLQPGEVPPVRPVGITKPVSSTVRPSRLVASSHTARIT